MRRSDRSSRVRPAPAAGNRPASLARAWRAAARAVAEGLENRQLLSAGGDGFVASFFGALYTSTSQFPAPHTNAGDYSTHLDQVYTPNGSQSVAPPDAPSTFNPAAGANGPGFDFSARFSTNIVVQQTGWFTFYPTTDDGAQLNLDGAAIGNKTLAAPRSPTEDIDPVPVQWQAGSTHALDLYYNNAGGGWDFELRWSATSASGGSGTSLIAKSLMTSPGAAGVASLQAPAPTVAPPAPAQTNATTTSVTLSWSSHDVDAASYIIERSAGGGPYFPVNASDPVATTNGGTVTGVDSGLYPGTQYSYKIVSNSIAGSSNPGVASEPTSPAATFTTLAANPPPVAGLRASFYNNPWWRSTNQSTTAIVSGGVAGAASLTVLTSDEQTVLPTVAGAGVDTGSGTLESGATNPKYPDPAGTIGPDNFSTAFTGQVNITSAGAYTFSINTDDDGYLFIDDQLASSYPGSHGANNAAVDYPLALTAGRHDVEMFQSNGGGGWDFHLYYSGPDTGGAKVVVPSSALSSAASTPVAPSPFTTAASTDPGAGTFGAQVVLTWGNNNTGAVRYVIQRSVDPTFSTAVTTFDVGLNGAPAPVPGGTNTYPATTNYTDTGLAGGTTYYYRIYAQNYDATSPPATAAVSTPPPAPTGLVALWTGSGAGASVSLTWSPILGQASYNVYRATTPLGEGATPIATGLTASGSTSGATVTYTDTNVTAGGTYYYQVTAVNPPSRGSLESGRSFEVASRTALPSTVFISEFQAINNNTLADASGGHPDWLELYNPTSSPVNLGGYYLTDTASIPTEWQIPSVSLAPGAFLVIFCDGTDQPNPSELHTNFSISGSGGYLALVAPDRQSVLSSYTYGQQLGDGSYGIALAQSNSGTTLVTSYGAAGYLHPTPRAPNGNIIGTSLSSPPTFDHPDGFYSAPFQLAITDATPGAQVYYTLDGSLPSTTNGTLYTGPLPVSGQTVVRAVAVTPGGVPSLPNAHTFIYTAQVVTQDADGSPPPGWPSNWGLSTEHYGMDPRVTNNAAYSGELQQDLLALPTFSISMNLSDLFDPANGIYSNSNKSGDAWTRPATIEYIKPDGTAGFTANAGVAIKGDFSASTPDAKHGFRLKFESAFGQKELDYPLFGPGGAQSFQEVDLRTDQNESWQEQNPANYIGIRDEFSNATIAALGNPGQRSQICLLYINGVFWGLYDAIDRTDADWAANTYGGKSSDYDVIKSGGNPNGFQLVATDGTATAYDQLVTDINTLDFTKNANYWMIQGKNPDGTPNPAYPDLLDVDNLIQYMMLIYYTGNQDAPNGGNNIPNNFYAVRPTDGSWGFRFMASDSETTLLDVNTNRVNSDTSPPTNATATPADFFQKLEVNPTFKRLVADYVQKDFYNNGPLTPTPALNRFKALAAQVFGPVALESARWGDVLRPSQPYTRNVEWQAEINRIENNYIPQRTGIVLSQLQAVGLVPTLSPPTFGQPGGVVTAGYKLTITNPNSAGSVYYTTDGSDPAGPTNAPAPGAVLYAGPVTLSATTEVKARVLSGTTWSPPTDATFDVALGSSVRVTELHYDPAVPLGGTYTSDDEEFIELKNFGTQAVNLLGTSFTAGLAYTFGNVTLAPGQVGVLVAKIDAFAALHPTGPFNGITVLGSYQGSGKHLSNSGEEVKLVDATGQTVADFTYSAAWYPTTAGGGPSLEVVNPAANPDLNLAASWRPSPVSGGTPGADDTVPPGPPANLAAAVQNGVVSLTWTAVAGATSYNVYRGTASGGEAATPIATGLTTASFNDTAVATGNTYYYAVTAANPGGTSPFSNEASAAVDVPVSPPSITQQPLSQLVKVGGTATFTAAATGNPPPTVQWNVSTDGGKTFSPIPAATSPTYSLTVTTAAVDGNQYQAVFTNSQGSATTNAATLTAIAPAFTAWNFDTSTKTGHPIPAGANTAPDPSFGAGTANSVGMALVSGPDASDIVADTGSSDPASTNQAWRIVGNNGWSSTAPLGSQGAQFFADTTGYSNISLQFDVDITAQGEGKLAVEYTTDGGATWSPAPALYANGAAGIAVALNLISANTVQGEYFTATGGARWYNRLTADFNGVPGVANNPKFGVRLVNAATGADCVNSTGQPLNNTSGNWRFDEVDLNGSVAQAPVVISVTPQDSSGNAASQRSIVSQFQVVFSTPVTLAAGAFTLSLVNNYGSGANDGSGNTPDTDVSQVLGTATNPSGDGTTWVVPVVQSGASTTYSYALAGGGASLQDGVYHLNVAASAVTASAGGTPMASSFISPLFHRLFGDTDGNKTVNALDYARFKTAFGSGSGAPGYNGDLDFDNSGTINAADYAQFKKRFGTTFTYP